MKHVVTAGLLAGIGGAITIFLYLTITLPLFFHVTSIGLYEWDASNILGIKAATHNPIAEIILVGQGSHLIVSLIWGVIFVTLAQRAPAIYQLPWLSGAIYGIFVMLFMHYIIVPLGHAPQNPYTLLGFANNLIAHTLFFGVPVTLVASRFTKETLRSYL